MLAAQNMSKSYHITDLRSLKKERGVELPFLNIQKASKSFLVLLLD
jgi:hypothetical protein